MFIIYRVEGGGFGLTFLARGSSPRGPPLGPPLLGGPLPGCATIVTMW